jgi:hypothetical protein
MRPIVSKPKSLRGCHETRPWVAYAAPLRGSVLTAGKCLVEAVRRLLELLHLVRHIEDHRTRCVCRLIGLVGGDGSIIAAANGVITHEPTCSGW